MLIIFNTMAPQSTRFSPSYIILGKIVFLAQSQIYLVHFSFKVIISSINWSEFGANLFIGKQIHHKRKINQV